MEEQATHIKYGIYTPKQLFIAACAGGPALAGFITAFNLWARGKKILSVAPAVTGLVLGIVLVFPVDYGAQFIRSFALRHILAFLLYFLLLALVAIVIRIVINRNYKLKTLLFPEIDNINYHPRKLCPVMICSFVFLLTLFISNFYLWTVLLLYLFTHFYFYILIHKTFGTSRLTEPVLALIFVLACLLPLIDSTGNIIARYSGKRSMSFTYLNLIAGYYTIFVFYLFLMISGIKGLLLINRHVRIISKANLANKSLVFSAILLSIISGVTILVIGTQINNNPVISRYSVSVPAQSSALKTLKLICVSDLHLKNITGKDFLKKLGDSIRKENPEIIVLPGDIAETYGNTSKEILEEFIDILKDIKPAYGIYAVRGNHDREGGLADKMNFYNLSGIKMLSDSLAESDDKFYIIGLKYRGNNETRPVDSLLQLRKKDLPVILLDHAPYCLQDAYKNNIDIQFSGHTHHGQIWPLNYITEAVYEVSRGYKKTGSTHLFVSCGVQDALMPGWQDFSVPVRTGSASEIMLVNIAFD